MASERKLLTISAACLLSQACFVFDDKFYKALEDAEEQDAGQQGNLLDGATDGGSTGDGDSSTDAASGNDASSMEIPLHLVNSCDAKDMYLLHDTHPPVEVSTVGFTDDISSTRCLPDVPGPEGWLAIDMVSGDRWHFHVHPSNKVAQGQAVQNPALYMRQDCADDRASCNAGTFLDLCGDGQDEHFTFEATSTTRWLFALDDVNGAAGSYLLTVAKPICGNGIQEHNEACEDSNLDNGDGCSRDCRVELRSDNLSHSEFNDDWTTANILSLVDLNTPQSVLGDIGGFCDQDLFGFNVPSDNVTVTVTIGPSNGPAGSSDCSQNPADVSPVTALRLIGSDGRSEQMKQESNDPTFCPSLTMSGLAAGFYYVAISGDETKKTFTYKLTVTLSK